ARMRAVLDAQPDLVRQAAEQGGEGARRDGRRDGAARAGGDPDRAPAEGRADPLAGAGAGSWLARDYVGLPGVVEGAPADLVAYPDDPRRDVEVLRRPSLVMLDGRVIITSAPT
ncbi:MAG: hypothetical protein WAL50_05245, partial [Kineosporiaceae bacterium]